VNGVVARVHAESANEGESISEALLAKVLAEHNSSHQNDDRVVAYGSVTANAAGSSDEATGGFSLVSAVTATAPSSVYYLKASSESVDGSYVVYFFQDTTTFKQGVVTVPKSRIDDGGFGEVVTPGETTSPTASPTTEPTTEPADEPTTEPTATTEPTVEPTPTPSPSATATVEPSPSESPGAGATAPPAATGPSIKSAADIVAYDANGELWNFGPTGNHGDRKSIGASGATIPRDFFVTDWDSDGVQDLVQKWTDGQLVLRKGLPDGGFTTSGIGNGWNDFEITVGKWKKTDPNPSIIAKHIPTGSLYNYPNPYGTVLDPRQPIGHGWGDFSPLNIVDWDRNGNMDILARNSNNDIILYRTNGAGGFLDEARQPVGHGWGFNSLHAISGYSGSGSVGLLALDGSNDLYYYPAIGGSWGARSLVSGGWSGYKIAGN
jgi:hypothetical protein